MFEFIESIKKVLNTIVEVVQTKVICALFDAFWMGNYYLAVAEKYLEKHNSHWIVQKFFTRKSILSEPPLNNWYSRFTLIKEDNQIRHNEKYSYSVEPSTAVVGDEIEKLYISKMGDYRVSKISTPSCVCESTGGEPEKSKVKFINVLYGHKSMTNMLTLKIDNQYMRDGTQLFSKSFVLRLLIYQYSPTDYSFDDDYELKVMDSKVHTEIMDSKSYMVIDNANKKGYTVVRKQ